MIEAMRNFSEYLPFIIWTAVLIASAIGAIMLFLKVFFKLFPAGAAHLVDQDLLAKKASEDYAREHGLLH